MFSSSSPNSDEMIDGCPVVHVSDSPEDLARLLRVLLPAAHRRFYREDAWTDYSFEEVYAVIRLAHKYNIEDVQKQALFALREYTFNDDFKKWREVRNERIPVDGPCAIGAVNLARLLDIPEMLLIALYKCLSLCTGILDGWKRSDGSIEYLSQDDVKRCIAATSELSRSSSILAYNIFRPEPCMECKQRSRCEESLRQALAEFLDLYAGDISDGSGIMVPWEGAFDEFGGCGVCEACWEEVKYREVSGREDVWDRFPKIFDVKTERWGSSVSDLC
ncbi:hypothetical protein GSI_12279 [Ganoderma sinense ZZ0214-1]|uniref:BTB domain-containing protein n=1 Tax=Ganoderma sinense ZZ0214-1 TaxID=1077348 RepID=A0A2G8RYC6_9APHY|nr:hypothetical protein GSI_12279 [Ganoderma sinense ZZ0214-1]